MSTYYLVKAVIHMPAGATPGTGKLACLILVFCVKMVVVNPAVDV